MRWLVLLILCGSIVRAEQAGRPACKEQNVGMFWPDQANWDRQAAQRAVHCGELQLCTRGVWTHSWQPLTVHVTQLGNGPKNRPFAVEGQEKRRIIVWTSSCEGSLVTFSFSLRGLRYSALLVSPLQVICGSCHSLKEFESRLEKDKKEEDIEQ